MISTEVCTIAPYYFLTAKGDAESHLGITCEKKFPWWIVSVQSILDWHRNEVFYQDIKAGS